MFLNKIHKRADKEKNEELKKLNEETNDKFLRWQVENNVRAQILHPYMENYIVGMTINDAILAWRPLTENEKNELTKKLAKKSGIDL
mgnify:FL=1